MLYREEFSFSEKPASDEERAVARVMQTYFKALCDHDADLLVSLFHADARIHSLAADGKIVSREEFVEALRGRLAHMKWIRLCDLRITIGSEDAATAYSQHQYVVNGKLSPLRLRQWNFKKKDGVWRISEAYYHAL